MLEIPFNIMQSTHVQQNHYYCSVYYMAVVFYCITLHHIGVSMLLVTWGIFVFVRTLYRLLCSSNSNLILYF